jgi:DNA-binding beta-propeller fold protein YncE
MKNEGDKMDGGERAGDMGVICSGVFGIFLSGYLGNPILGFLMNASRFLVTGCLLLLTLAPASIADRVSVFAGQGGPPPAEGVEPMKEPFSIDFMGDGFALIVEFMAGNRIWAVEPGGESKVVSGMYSQTDQKMGDIAKGDGGPALKATFNGMHDVAITKGGDTYVVDTWCHRVRKIDGEGVITTIAGTGRAGFSGDGGPAAEAEFNQPYCCCLSPSEDKLYIADLANARVREIDLKTGIVRTVAGNGQKGKPDDGVKAVESPLTGPRAVTVDADGNLYIVSREGNALLVVSPDGIIKTLVNAAGAKGYEGDGGPGLKAKLNGPKYLCMSPEGDVMIVDTENHVIRRYEPDTGKIHLVAGVPEKAGDAIGKGPLDTELKRPHGVRFDKQGRLYITDSDNHRVLLVEP